MIQCLLHEPQIPSLAKQARGKGVPKHVRVHGLGDA